MAETYLMLSFIFDILPITALIYKFYLFVNKKMKKDDQQKDDQISKRYTELTVNV